MNITFVVNNGNGVPPFSGWKTQFTTKNTQVPSIGEQLQDGSYRYLVTDIVWNYGANTVFVHVQRNS